MSKESTALDTAFVSENGEAKMSQKDLDSHIVRLMLEEPFYAGVLRGVNYIRTNSIPTAGVTTKDCEITMLWNPHFMDSLTRDQIKGLLKHESMHLALCHTTDRRMEPHIIHNYATDLAINSDIPKNELPEGGLIPGEEFKSLTEEQVSKMSDEAVARYYRISSKISSLPSNMSSEWYFTELLEDEEVSKDIQDSSDQDGSEMMDSHEGWGEGLTEEEKEIVKAKIKQSVSDAAKECDRTGRWGSVGAETRDEIRRIITNEVNWRAVLKKFCGFSRRGTRTTSWTRLNKKYAGLVSGVKRGYTSSIAVYIDQSGSVGKDDLELAFGELAGLTKRTSFTTFHFDTSVDVDSETSWSRGKTPEAYRTRCGGTDFECVTQHANKNSHRFDGYIIITDGEAAKPSAGRLKRGWLLVPSSRMAFTPSNRDFVMEMKK